MNQQILMIGCVFGMVTLIAYAISKILFNDGDKKLRNRLAGEEAQAQPGEKKPSTSLLQKMGGAAAQPFMPKTREQQSALRRQLGYAGIYSPTAFRVITGCKLIFLVIGLAAGYGADQVFGTMMLGLPIGGLLGYLAPRFWLKMQIAKNQKMLNYGLPDGLDLMVVCVEAGLTIDAAMQRVGQELAIAHPQLSKELAIAHMEMRVGLSRAESLKNLGIRTGNAALQSLSAMLVQADRFGTSIASALRIHAESLRNNRQLAAEELAAKASVKMSFPLVLFILPATFIVLAGPVVIQLMQSDL